MSMKIKKGDLVQVITGRTSDADKIAKRNETRAEKGKGELTAAVTIVVTGASKSAVEAVEKAGGKVTLPAQAEAAAE